MPYIITTQAPDRTVWEGKRSTVVTRPPVTRRAVTTLEEARQDARNLVEDHANIDGVWTDAWIRARTMARELPESGGTIGPLPDGTVIEVKPATVERLAYAVPHIDGPPDAYEVAYLIDAYNAAQS